MKKNSTGFFLFFFKKKTIDDMLFVMVENFGH